MFKQLAIASLISLCSLSQARAENWTILGITEDDNRPHYLDMDSIQGSNGYYKYWISYSIPNKNLIFSGQSLIACRERTTKLLVARQYTPNGRLIASYNYGNTQKPRPILVGSMSSLAWEAICQP